MAIGGYFTNWLYSNFKMPRGKPFSEMGTGGTALYGGHIASIEKSAKWVGAQKYVTASEIATNISIVAAGVHYFLNLVAHPKWTVKPAKPKSGDKKPKLGIAKPGGSRPTDVSGQAQKMADFVQECMENTDTPWQRIVRRSGMYRFHGFGLQEWIARKRDDGQIEFKDIEPRPQFSIERWAVDEEGTIEGVAQRSPQNFELLLIPRKKLVYLVDDTLSDSPEGMGLFRHLAEPYERLKRYLELEAKGFERDLRGTPIGRAPYAALRKAVADGELTEGKAKELVEGMEAFVRAQVKMSDTSLMLDSVPYENASAEGMKFVATPQWGIELLQGGAAGLAELNTAVDRIQREMARILGVEQLMLGDTGGNRALAVDKSRNLYLIANSVLSNIAMQYNKDLIEPLWLLNAFDEDLKPTFQVEDVAFKDVSEVVTALQGMAQAGAVLSPDDPVIDDVRDLLGISKSVKPTPEQMGVVTGKQPGQDQFGGKKPGDKEEQTQADIADEGTGKPKKPPFVKYSPDQPRDDTGKWTEGGGGEHPGKGYSTKSYVQGGKVYTNNVNDAVRALHENRPVVLHSIKQVSTLLGRLREVTKKMIDKGKDAPNFNLCNVSVQGSNLFCAESKGIPRIEMPQLKDPKGLLDSLREQGVKVEKDSERASYLKATQNELNGAKVAGIAHKMMAGKMEGDEERLFVSRDNYIVDGHHRWAATVGVDALDGRLGDARMKVYRVNMDIIPLLKQAEKFSGEHKGAGPADANKSIGDVLKMLEVGNESVVEEDRVIIKLKLAA